MTQNKKLWSGRFSKETNKFAEKFNASIDVDVRLALYDIEGSIAHAKALKKAKILTPSETNKIIKGLNSIESEILKGKFKTSLAMEDVHMAIEQRLTKKIGSLGGKLHTARSRNDQVATDVRLYLKDELASIYNLIEDLQIAIIKFAKTNIDIIIPGYTHLQKAQPILMAHHMLAYFEMLDRDKERIVDTFTRTDVLPLGSGALAGTPYNIDRNYIAKLLNFDKVSENSIDAVSDRDFIMEFLSNGSIIMAHLSRLSEEFILWSSDEFSFITIGDDFTTGSSIMPQKKNPDMPELVRGKTGRVYGNLIAMLTTMKGLPLAYNKDMQEDKEPLFDTVDTVTDCLTILTLMIESTKVVKSVTDKSTSGGFLTATDGADYLVGKGMPFRDTHNVMGKIVAWCLKNNKELEDLTLGEWKKFSKLFEKDILKTVTIKASVNARKSHGGTATSKVKARLTKIEKSFKK